MQRVTISSTCYHTRYHTRYSTFSLSLTWIGHNATQYHNFNVLLHALPSFSLVWSGTICNALPRVTVKFMEKYILIFFLKKMMLTCADALQIAQNQANLRENIW